MIAAALKGSQRALDLCHTGIYRLSWVLIVMWQAPGSTECSPSVCRSKGIGKGMPVMAGWRPHIEEIRSVQVRTIGRHSSPLNLRLHLWAKKCLDQTVSLPQVRF